MNKWCETCQEWVSDDEVEIECMYEACPIPAMRAIDTGDDLHQILGEALRQAGDQ